MTVFMTRLHGRSWRSWDLIGGGYRLAAKNVRDSITIERVPIPKERDTLQACFRSGAADLWIRWAASRHPGASHVIRVHDVAGLEVTRAAQPHGLLVAQRAPCR